MALQGRGARHDLFLIASFDLLDDFASRITPDGHCALSGLFMAMKSGWPAVGGYCGQD